MPTVIPPPALYYIYMDISQYTDKEIVAGLLRRDKAITIAYLYEKCYPLFKALFEKYDTDCENCIEFINEIYVYIMAKSSKSDLSKLEAFSFKCQFIYWLKIVSENYCHTLFKKSSYQTNKLTDGGDSLSKLPHSIIIESHEISLKDAETILLMMPNRRYSQLIRHRYLEEHTNEETAALLGMNINNYYNKHRLAKAQFRSMLIKEGLL